MAFSPPTPPIGPWFSILASVLDPRSAPRLARRFVGALRAQGRRTVTRWIRAGGLSSEFRSCSTAVAAVGRKTERIAPQLRYEVLPPFLTDVSRLVFAVDDTPTPRYGPQVPGAGIHPNPTPGPAGGSFV